MVDNERKSCWSRFDEWLWNRSYFTRAEKCLNHVRGNRYVSDNVLFGVRIVMLLMMTAAEIAHFNYWITVKKRYDLQYLTIIALHIAYVHFLLLVISHIRHKLDIYYGKVSTEEAISASICHLWKWTTCLFTVTSVT